MTNKVLHFRNDLREIIEYKLMIVARIVTVENVSAEFWDYMGRREEYTTRLNDPDIHNIWDHIVMNCIKSIAQEIYTAHQHVSKGRY